MATAAPQQRLDIGTVISIGFRALGRNFPAFAAFALLLVGLPTFAVEYLLWGELLSEAIPFASPYYWLSLAVSWLTGYLLQAIIVRAVVLDLSGRRPDIGDSVTAAVAKLLPMIGLSIVSGIGVMFGMLLLIVPGVILMLMWSVAVPVLIEERRGVFDSLGRSAELTRGSKVWIFLLMLLYIGVSTMIAGAVLALSGFELPTGEEGPRILPIAAAALAQTLNSLLFAAMVAALYVELRRSREGASADHLAAVFE